MAAHYTLRCVNYTSTWGHRHESSCIMYHVNLVNRLNMKLDLQSLRVWAPCAQLYSLAETRNPSYTRALLVSQDRRHLFVTPWRDIIFQLAQRVLSTSVRCAVTPPAESPTTNTISNRWLYTVHRTRLVSQLFKFSKMQMEIVSQVHLKDRTVCHLCGKEYSNINQVADNMSKCYGGYFFIEFGSVGR
jgi:hypothetical protein